MATFNKFNSFTTDVGSKVHNFTSDTLKVCLSNTAPVATNTILANITQITAANGYTAGGTACTSVTYTNSAGTTAKLVATGPVFTASGGSIGPLEYVVLYNSTAASGNLIGWYDYGSAITLANGETFTVTLDLTNGTLTIA